MTTLKASKARIPTKAFDKVARKGQRIRIERRDGQAIYLVSAEEVSRIEEADDAYWSKVGRKALEEWEKSGRKTVSWEKTKRELGL